jgi:hypothetical protein
MKIEDDFAAGSTPCFYAGCATQKECGGAWSWWAGHEKKRSDGFIATVTIYEGATFDACVTVVNVDRIGACQTEQQ